MAQDLFRGIRMSIVGFFGIFVPGVWFWTTLAAYCFAILPRGPNSDDAKLLESPALWVSGFVVVYCVGCVFRVLNPNGVDSISMAIVSRCPNQRKPPQWTSGSSDPSRNDTVDHGEASAQQRQSTRVGTGTSGSNKQEGKPDRSRTICNVAKRLIGMFRRLPGTVHQWLPQAVVFAVKYMLYWICSIIRWLYRTICPGAESSIPPHEHYPYASLRRHFEAMGAAKLADVVPWEPPVEEQVCLPISDGRSNASSCHDARERIPDQRMTPTEGSADRAGTTSGESTAGTAGSHTKRDAGASECGRKHAPRGSTVWVNYSKVYVSFHSPSLGALLYNEEAFVRGLSGIAWAALCSLVVGVAMAVIGWSNGEFRCPFMWFGTTLSNVFVMCGVALSFHRQRLRELMKVAGAVWLLTRDRNLEVPAPPFP